MPRERTADVWDLWLRAPRGAIARFGDYQEWLEDGEVANYEEFQDIWLDCFPDKEYWYTFTAIERKEEQYRGIFLNHRMIIEQYGKPSAGVPLDIHEFAEWLLQSINICMDALKRGDYNQFIEDHLPVQHRTGTICGKTGGQYFRSFKRNSFLGSLRRI